MQWYYAQEGQQLGPVEEDAFRAMASDGRLKPTDLVWNEQMGQQWVEARTVPGLFAHEPEPAQAALMPPAMPPQAEPQATEPAATPGPGGQVTNVELTAQARESLTGNWGPAIGVVVVYALITGTLGSIPLVGPLATLILTGPFTLGLAMYFLDLARRKNPPFSYVFQGFNQFGTSVGAYLLTSVFVFLWSLLLIVPGIIAAFAYALTFFIMSDDNTIGPLDAIRRSKELMRGYKWKYFCLSLRFFGWALVCLLTCGIGFLWLVPYMSTSFAHFYEDVMATKGQQTPE